MYLLSRTERNREMPMAVEPPVHDTWAAVSSHGVGLVPEHADSAARLWWCHVLMRVAICRLRYGANLFGTSHDQQCTNLRGLDISHTV